MSLFFPQLLLLHTVRNLFSSPTTCLFLAYFLSFSSPTLHYFFYLFRYSVVGIATKLRAEWFGVQFLVVAPDLCLLQKVQTGSGAHPASYAMGTGFYPGDKPAGSWH